MTDYEIEKTNCPEFFLLTGPPIDFPQKLLDSLGGVIRIAEVTAETAKPEIAQQIADLLSGWFPEGKIRFGLSVFSEQKGDIRRTLSAIKRLLRERDRSVRFINRDFGNLDAGTLFREGVFTKKTAAEIILVPGRKGEWQMARTMAAQNIWQFAKRDYGKPVRDMRVGMLPPKLALMLVNLAAKNGKLPVMLWDPFCGSGTILVEAFRLGIDVAGSDFSAKMIEAAEQNLAIVPEQAHSRLFLHDATKPLSQPVDAEAVVTEGYLGPIYGKPLSEKDLGIARSRVEPVFCGFLRAIAAQRSVRKLVFCLPFWQMENKKDAFCVEPLAEAARHWQNAFTGDNGKPAPPLRFRRPGQIVGREIFVLERKQ